MQTIYSFDQTIYGCVVHLNPCVASHAMKVFQLFYALIRDIFAPIFIFLNSTVHPNYNKYIF